MLYVYIFILVSIGFNLDVYCLGIMFEFVCRYNYNFSATFNNI